jgi:hypothetical protein
MAYKFQFGPARLSGSTTFEEPLVGVQSISAASLSASAGLEIGGTVRLDGAADTAAAVASDSFYFFDADDNLVKKESMADYATTIAGDGLAASSGVLAVDVSDFAGTGLEDDGSENLRIAAAAAGDGLGGGGGSALSVNVDDTGIEISSDALRLKDLGVSTAKIADDAVTPAKMSLFDDSLAATDTHILIADGSDYSSFALSGDVTMTNAGVVSIGATKVTDAMLNDDVASGLAGVGLSAASGVLALDASELSAADVASGDLFVFQDASDDSTKKESIDDIATFMAGVGLGASGGVLAVQVSGAIVLDNDRLGLSGSVAGAGLAFAGGPESLSSLSFDPHASGGLTEDVASTGQAGIAFSAMGEETIDVADDYFMFADGSGTGPVKKESVADLMAAVAGAGLADSSGVLAVGAETNGGIAVLANGVKMDLSDLSAAAVDASADSIAILDATDSSTKLESIADLAIAMAGNGIGPNAGTFDLDLNELTDASVDVATDSIAIVDADDSNGSKKERISDLVAAMAGAGLTDTNGVLSVTGNNVASKADGDTLAEGYNFFGTVSAAATVTLPASPSIGDVVTVKAKDGVSATNYIKISKAGSQTIDGETEVRIESPYGAVSMVYVASNDWRII